MVKSNNIKERLVKNNVNNQLTANYFIEISERIQKFINHKLSVSFYYFNGESGRRTDASAPTFFSGFKIMEPRDNYVYNSLGDQLIQKYDADNVLMRDHVIDDYTQVTRSQYTPDGWVLFNCPIPNNLTGYLEGSVQSSPTDNPYGLTNMFIGYGNNNGYSFNKSYGIKIKYDFDAAFNLWGTYNKIRTGAQFSIGNFDRNQVYSPWTVGTVDIYSDRFGGNLFTDNQDVKDKTSQPHVPTKFSIYVDDFVKYSDFFLNFGARLDYLEANYYTIINPYYNEYGNQADGLFYLNPAIIAGYDISKNTTIAASFSIKQEAPDFSSLYDLNMGMSTMIPLRTTMIDAKLNHSFADLFDLSLTAYKKFFDKDYCVVYVPIVPTPYYQISMGSNGYSWGFEFELKNRFDKNFNYSLGYSYSKVYGIQRSTDYFVHSEPYEFLQSYDIPHRFSVILNYTFKDSEGPIIFGITPLENMFATMTYFAKSGSPLALVSTEGKFLGIESEGNPWYWTVNLRISKTIKLNSIFSGGFGNTAIEFSIDIYNVLNRTEPLYLYASTRDPDDNGSELMTQPGSFTSVPYYEKGNYNNLESISIYQYDSRGNRLYNKNADFNSDGKVTQDEMFKAYQNYIEDKIRLRQNYQTPRSVYFNIILRI